MYWFIFSLLTLNKECSTIKIKPLRRIGNEKYQTKEINLEKDQIFYIEQNNTKNEVILHSEKGKAFICDNINCSCGRYAKLNQYFMVTNKNIDENKPLSFVIKTFQNEKISLYAEDFSNIKTSNLEFSRNILETTTEDDSYNGRKMRTSPIVGLVFDGIGLIVVLVFTIYLSINECCYTESTSVGSDQEDTHANRSSERTSD